MVIVKVFILSNFRAKFSVILLFNYRNACEHIYMKHAQYTVSSNKLKNFMHFEKDLTSDENDLLL